jgi:hypothetical protein
LILRALILTLWLSFLWPSVEAFASGAIEARQRALQQQQIQAVRAQQQQAIAAQQRAYQQAIAARQAQIQQQAVSQAVAQRNAQQQAYNAAVERKLQNVIQQNQMAAASAQQQIIARVKAEQQAYNQLMAAQGVMMSQAAAQTQPQMSMPAVAQPAYGNLFYTPPVEEVVNITDVWAKMEESSRVWQSMIDMEPKILTVSRMVDHFKNQGITIRKAPSHYVQLIDSMAFQNPQMLEQPFENIMKVVAIIEYDFDNGQNKDALARQIFSDDEQFNANKKRLGF